MQRFQNVLCVVDPVQDSVSAINRSALLARRNGAELSVAGVLDDVRSGSARADAAWPDVRDLVVEESASAVERLLDRADLHGLAVRRKLLVGTPFVEIIREVLRQRHDLVILTAEGSAGLRQWLLGSTSMHLMRKCPCPVWVMKPDQARFRRIMACVDPDPEFRDPQRRALDERVLQLGTSLARRESAPLHIVHAWWLFGEQMLLRRTSREWVDQWLRETREAHRNELEELIGQVNTSGIACHTHLVKGMPRDVLPSTAARLDIDLMVMGTVCRTGVAGLLIGNTAEIVLRQVDCSVLAVKPEGFVTPVALDGG